MAAFEATVFCCEVLILPFSPHQFLSTAKNTDSPSCHREPFASVSHLPVWLSLAWSGASSSLCLLRRSFLSRGAVRHLVGRWGGYSWMLNECVKSCSWEKTVSLLCSCSRSDVIQSWTWILRIHGGVVKWGIRGPFKGIPSESAWIMNVSNSLLLQTRFLSLFWDPTFHSLMIAQTVCKLTQGAETEERRSLTQSFLAFTFNSITCTWLLHRYLSSFNLSYSTLDEWKSGMFSSCSHSLQDFSTAECQGWAVLYRFMVMSWVT